MGRAVARHRTRAELLTEAEQALSMRLRGYTDPEICRTLGFSRATLHRRINLALEQRINPTVDAYRAEQRERITLYRRRLLDELARTSPRTLIDADTGEEVLVPAVGPLEVASLLGRLVQLEERLAKLDGLDAPTRVSLESTVDTELAALAEQLAANDRHTATTP